MKKHKLYSLAMTGALSFGILGTSFPAMAAPIQTTASESGGGALDEETKDKAQTIMDELKAQLADLGVEMPERGGKMDKFAGLDEETIGKSTNNHGRTKVRKYHSRRSANTVG